MSTREKINHFLRKIKIYLVPIITQSNLDLLLSRLGPFLIADAQAIYAYLEMGKEKECLDMLLSVMAYSDIGAFREFVNLVAFDGRFHEIRAKFIETLQFFQLEDFLSAKIQTAVQSDASRHGDKKQAVITDSFKRIIVDNSTEEDKLNFKKLCVKYLDGGFVFKFVMLNAIIDDLICHTMPATLALKEAKIAIQNLLPYALNLCRSPNRKEYKTVKKYTAHYHARIKNNLKCSPNIADSILECMGYKPTEYPDEAVLDKPSKSILDIALELYLCELKINSLLSMVEKLTAGYNMPANKILSAWLEETQKHHGKVTEKEVLKSIKGVLSSIKGMNVGLGNAKGVKGSEYANLPSKGGKSFGRSKTERETYHREDSEGWMYDNNDDDDVVAEVSKNTDRANVAKHTPGTENYKDTSSYKQTARIKIEKVLDPVDNMIENVAYGSVLSISSRDKGTNPSLGLDDPSNRENRIPTDFVHVYGEYGNFGKRNKEMSSLELYDQTNRENRNTGDLPRVYGDNGKVVGRNKEPWSLTDPNNRDNRNHDDILREYGQYDNLPMPSAYLPQQYTDRRHLSDKDTIIYKPPADDNDFQSSAYESRYSSLNSKSGDSFAKDLNNGPRPDPVGGTTEYYKQGAALSSIGDAVEKSKESKMGSSGKQSPRSMVSAESIYDNYKYKPQHTSYNESIPKENPVSIPAVYGNVTASYQPAQQSKGEVMGNEFVAKGMPAIYQRD